MMALEDKVCKPMQLKRLKDWLFDVYPSDVVEVTVWVSASFLRVSFMF